MRAQWYLVAQSYDRNKNRETKDDNNGDGTGDQDADEDETSNEDPIKLSYRCPPPTHQNSQHRIVAPRVFESAQSFRKQPQISYVSQSN